MSSRSNNTFLTAPLGSVYAKTALPIIFVMAMNGLLSVVDAIFLGIYVGPDALAAVTLMFPVYMLIVALSTLVSSGTSSILARHLGGGRIDQAQQTFAGAHGLALMVGGILIAGFFVFGSQVTSLAAGGNQTLSELGLIYLRITVLFAPLMFVLSINSDSLRNEGRVGFMAAMSLLVSLANMAFNYVLIAKLNLGVAGSAYGTALAQLLAFAIILHFRIFKDTHLRPSALWTQSLMNGWGRILALGAPQSLGFLGLSLGSASVVIALQWVNTPSYENTVSAYGIITRIMTFAYLPLLGLSHAMQTITGNNFGAENWQRSNTSLRIALGVSLAYCGVIQLVFWLAAPQFGAIFVDDTVVISEVARILPIIILVMFLTGPLMIISSYFQATGDATRAAILGLSKPYVFAIPLTFVLADRIGEIGIWLSGPLAELLLLGLTLLVLGLLAKRENRLWGLFHPTKGRPA